MREQAAGELALGKVILGARLHGLQSQFVILAGRQDDDRQVGRRLVNGAECVQALAIGERQVQQHAIDAALGDAAQARFQICAMLDKDLRGRRVAERFAHQPHVGRIIFDQQEA